MNEVLDLISIKLERLPQEQQIQFLDQLIGKIEPQLYEISMDYLSKRNEEFL